MTDEVAVDRRSLRRVAERRPWTVPVGCFCAIAAVMAVLQHVSNRVLRDPNWRLFTWQGLHQYFDGWNQFDSTEYLKIVEHGYSYTPGVRSTVVWFPLYPLATRGLHLVMSDAMIAGVVVSFVAGLVATVLYWRWLAQRGIEGRVQVVALLTLLLYPYAWYLYGVPHSDSMFLALVVGAFLLVERDHPVLGGLVGALATATRPNGLTIIPALLLLAMQRDGVLAYAGPAVGAGRVRRWLDRYEVPLRLDRSRLRWATFAPLLAVLGVAAYSVYLGIRFGDPFAYVTNSEEYHQEPYPYLKLAFFVSWRDMVDPTFPLTRTAQAGFAVLCAVLVPSVGRRFGWAYGVFVALMVVMPWLTVGDFMGTGRYLIAAFPVAALAGEWLAEHRRARIAWFAVATVAVFGLNMGFSRSWYLS